MNYSFYVFRSLAAKWRRELGEQHKSNVKKDEIEQLCVSVRMRVFFPIYVHMFFDIFYY